MSGMNGIGYLGFFHFDIGICFGFRDSDFEIFLNRVQASDRRME